MVNFPIAHKSFCHHTVSLQISGTFIALPSIFGSRSGDYRVRLSKRILDARIKSPCAGDAYPPRCAESDDMRCRRKENDERRVIFDHLDAEYVCTDYREITEYSSIIHIRIGASVRIKDRVLRRCECDRFQDGGLLLTMVFANGQGLQCSH